MNNYIDNESSSHKKTSRKKAHKKMRKLKLYTGIFIIFAIILCLSLSFKYFNNNSKKTVATMSTTSIASNIDSNKGNEKSNINKNIQAVKEISPSSEKEISTKSTKNNLNNNKPKNSNNSKKCSTGSVSTHNADYSVFADQAFNKDGQKVAFLTFDDGPTRNITPRILDTLKHYDVKATFFVLGQLAEQNSDLLKREYEEGHSIGNHSYTHNYKKIYSNVPNFIQEISTANTIIEKNIGNDFKTALFRFPGGSFEKSKNPFKEKLNSEGIRYIDWNVSSGDAAGQNVPVENILNNIKSTSAEKNHIVVLMHDASTKKTTADALPQIIEYLKSQGYVFKTLK